VGGMGGEEVVISVSLPLPEGRDRLRSTPTFAAGSGVVGSRSEDRAHNYPAPKGTDFGSRNAHILAQHGSLIAQVPAKVKFVLEVRQTPTFSRIESCAASGLADKFESIDPPAE